MTTYISNQLFELQDLSYKKFQSKLIPTINSDCVIGVRTPALKKLGKQLLGTPEAEEFLKYLPHTYYEENNLHAFFITKIKDYDSCIDALEKFLPFVDNWATCDGMSPKIFKKHLDRLQEQIKIWIDSEDIYTIRFAIKMLMDFYLDDNFSEEYLELVSKVRSDEYYVKMMAAWYFATALAKQWDATVFYIENQCLDVWIHNKTIQKAVESYRITKEQKEYLKTLKRR